MKNIYIVAAVRSALCRANKGSFANLRADDLAAQVAKACVDGVSGFDASLIEDVLWGCAMPEGEQGMNIARNVSFLAGLPNTVAGATVNRFCASSLFTVMMAYQAILAGCGEVILAGGVESMSHVPMGGFNPSLHPRLCLPDAPQAYVSMGITAENVAKKFNVTRADQDAFALLSHQKAVQAIQKGEFKNEIVAVAVPNGENLIQVTQDEGPRADSTLEKLSTLKPVFLEGGSVTAGNSSPLTDGASAVLVMNEAMVKKLKLKPLARIVAMAVSGCDPAFMGMGPVDAVNKVLARAELGINQIDSFELNEAFAAQSLAVMRELKLDANKVNPSGGAISLGHPLGASGGRIIATLAHRLKRQNQKFGVATMCVGGGQGAAIVLENVD